MQLVFGPFQSSVRLDASRICVPERLYERVARLPGPHWLRVEGRLFRLSTEDVLLFACDIVSAEHNAVALRAGADDDDAFEREMAELEARARGRMDESSADDEDSEGRVTPTEDLVYEREVYI